MNKTYAEMLQYNTFLDRFDYLKLDGYVGRETFGWDRYLNQALYASTEWKKRRREVIIRDDGNDLGLDGYLITGRIIVHHIMPITPEMIDSRDPLIFDMNNLICVSYQTHEALHYGNIDLLNTDPIERKPGDTKLW